MAAEAEESHCLLLVGDLLAVKKALKVVKKHGKIMETKEKRRTERSNVWVYSRKERRVGFWNENIYLFLDFFSFWRIRSCKKM